MIFEKRREKARKIVTDQDLDFLLIENVTDIFYLTGVSVSAGKIVLSKKEATFFVDSRYFEEVQKKTTCDVKLYQKTSFEKYLFEHSYQIGLDADHISYSQFQNYQSLSKKKLIALKNPLKNLRLIKDKKEISTLKKAAEITWKGYEHICTLLKEGITEKEIAFAFEMFVRKHKAEGLSFEPIIAFGENTAHPHHRSSDTRLKKNQPVLFDLGIKYQHYASDMTRMFFFGTASKEIQKMYALIKEAYKAALDQIILQMPIQNLDRAARDVFKKAGYEKFFTHSLGHSVGLEVHEYPIIRSQQECLITPGMVFTIEPGLYQAGIGGVRFEDMICITDKSWETFFPY